MRFEGRETDFLLNPDCLTVASDQSVALKPGTRSLSEVGMF